MADRVSDPPSSPRVSNGPVTPHTTSVPAPAPVPDDVKARLDKVIYSDVSNNTGLWNSLLVPCCELLIYLPSR